MSQDSKDYKLFESRPGVAVLLLPDALKFTIVTVSNDFSRSTGMKKEAIIGKSIFEVFPASPMDVDFTGEQNLRTSFEHVLQQKQEHQMPIQRYDIPNSDGSFTEKYWEVLNVPFIDDAGEVLYIINNAEDITSQVKSQQQSEALIGLEKAYNLFMSAPVIITVVRGEDYIIDLANESMLRIWGRGAEVIGMPLLRAIPELAGQGILEMLNQVRKSGEPFYAFESPTTIFRNGKNETLYFDFVYQPYFENNKDTMAAGVIGVAHDVTEKILARNKVHESESKYRSLFETMDQGFCILEVLFNAENKALDYQFLETNPVFEQQTGLKDAIGKTARELVPNLEAHWFDLYGQVALTGIPTRFTEGSEAMGRWFDVYAFRIGDHTSRKVALLFTDITQRKYTEEALKRSEQNLRNIILKSPVAMCILKGPSFVVDVANERIIEIWGKEAGDVLGKPVFEGLPEAVEQGLEPLLQQVYTTGNSFAANERPVKLLRKGKIETVFINFVYDAFRSGDGTITGVIAIAIEVTEQVVIRKKVEENETRMRLAVESTRLGTFEINLFTRSILASPRVAEIFGLNPANEWPYTTYIKAVHPDDVLIREKAHEISRETGKLFYEVRILLPDGTISWIRLNGIVTDKDNAKVLIGTVLDITEEKKAAELLEQKIEERTRELKQANEQLRQFTYAASHDLQEPLRKISFFVDRLITGMGLSISENQKHFADRILHTTKRMSLLINDLLDYSNTTLGTTGFKHVDLAAIIKDVLDETEATLIKKEAIMDVQELPEVKGDPRQLRQLFQNLISNALKYHNAHTPPHVVLQSKIILGAEAYEVVPQEKWDLSFHHLQIKDNGIGFDQQNAKAIFGLFQRLHGKSEYEGTGVGLAIVQKVVENHNGYIWAESTPGKGATFNILLPAD